MKNYRRNMHSRGIGLHAGVQFLFFKKVENLPSPDVPKFMSGCLDRENFNTLISQCNS